MAAKKERPGYKRGKANAKRRGVAIVAPQPARGIGWRVRYVDPDTGRQKAKTIPAEDAGSADKREAFARDLAAKLNARRVDLDRPGAVHRTGAPLEEVIEVYFREHPRIRDRTRAAYRGATGHLLEWAKRRKVRTVDDLTQGRLLQFRSYVAKMPKHTATKGGRRGQWSETAEKRSAVTINRDLRSARTVLGYLVDRQLLPELTHDGLRRALRREAVTHERLDFLRTPELQRLLDAAVQHDGALLSLSREEKARGLKPGESTTPAHVPMAPLVAFVLLSGCRFAEALALRSKDLELEGGAPALYFRGAETKTKRGRTVDLAVSPALVELLRELEAQRVGAEEAPLFGHTRDSATAGAKRLRDGFEAPKGFNWPALRRTCGTFLTCAPGIFGGSSAYRSAKQLGHSVEVAERHYTGLVRNIPKAAATLEAAMGIEPELIEVIEQLRSRGEPATADAAE